MTSVSTKISFENLPKLSYDPSTYASWRKAIEVYLQIGDVWNVVSGNVTTRTSRATMTHQNSLSYPEFNETRSVKDRTVTGNDTEPGRVGVRPDTERAGSVPPITPTEGQVVGRRITGEELKEWEKWQARENKAQGMIKGTVTEAVMLDLSEKMSAKEMWDYCLKMHITATNENQRNVRQALFSYDLREDATAKEMAKHVEDFSKTMAEAKLAGLRSWQD
ncbi:hypothetical protein M231_01197 [Tremella mesenterica]|uniref:DUF4219 domain-containing protein n=1 Tax=Tremella mesenterica TaxID=5217 RepID=A0A4Q1BTS4_TREME|nr:hypothetical protein M231_01197 [Tremella mesenterica]